jgi:transcriptional regulator MraZ
MAHSGKVAASLGFHEGEMDQFVSTFTNRIDTKGRVSVPASFRTVLAKDGFEGIYCYPSLDAPALDAGGQRLVANIERLVGDLAPYSDAYDNLTTALYGTSDVLTLDQDGRTILPERLREHAGIVTHVTFVGLGEKFQIWEPGRFETHLAEARQKVRDLRKLLGAGRSGGGPEGARE